MRAPSGTRTLHSILTGNGIPCKPFVQPTHAVEEGKAQTRTVAASSIGTWVPWKRSKQASKQPTQEAQHCRQPGALGHVRRRASTRPVVGNVVVAVVVVVVDVVIDCCRCPPARRSWIAAGGDNVTK